MSDIFVGGIGTEEIIGKTHHKVYCNSTHKNIGLFTKDER
jgi:hypothetical protein